MGTRNLTMVINQEGETKVAQYGQWDGYPSGVGASVLSFLKNKELVFNNTIFRIGLFLRTYKSNT